MPKGMSPYAYKKIADTIADIIRREGIATVYEVAGKIGTSPWKVMKAWYMYGDNYPDILLTPEKDFVIVKGKTSLVDVQVGREIKEEEVEEKEKKVEEALLSTATQEEIPKEDLEEKEFNEKYPEITRYLGEKGGGDLEEVAIRVGISPEVLKRQWVKKERNIYVKLEGDRFKVDSYAAFTIANRVADLVSKIKLITVRDVASQLHVREEAVRSSWELCGYLIPYVYLEGDVFKWKGGDNSGEKVGD